RDVKVSYLKALQGYLWLAGYESGEIKAPLFPDVSLSMRAWHDAGIKLIIYSSGSVPAQKLLFGHTNAQPPNLIPIISDWFDTVNAGMKMESSSYTSILSRYPDTQPQEWLFLSDNVDEVTAARAAGMHSLVVVRPGNAPLPECHVGEGQAVRTFEGLAVDLAKCGIQTNDGQLPIVVGAIDGVGTKLLIAQKMGKHDTVGIDLVAMNVNDLVVQGARPLMFLDYYGCSKLDLSTAASFVEGVAAGCIDAGCTLVGGETAEMPGMYQKDDYDAAGCAVGVMTGRHRLPRTQDMAQGDVLLGLSSSGVHSNGFSLVRKIVEREGLQYSDQAPWDQGRSVGENLLTPTRIYVKSLRGVVEKGLVKGLAHITGGGLIDNVPRMLPDELAAEIDLTSWQVPAVFKWLKISGNVEALQMCRTFNMGI
ncbi:hypothetical protein BN1723_017777, partial [Verticillium longisporum]